MGPAVNDLDTVTQVRVELANLTGRLDQVLIDNKNQLERNAADIATEKRDRIADVRDLRLNLETHIKESSAAVNEFAKETSRDVTTLKANIKDHASDIRTMQERMSGAWPRILQGGAAIAAVVALGYSIWKG